MCEYFGLDATNFTSWHDRLLKAEDQRTEKQGILCWFAKFSTTWIQGIPGCEPLSDLPLVLLQHFET